MVPWSSNRVIFWTLFGALDISVYISQYMKPGAITFVDFTVFRGHTDIRQTDKQTRTSYLGTGVAD